MENQTEAINARYEQHYAERIVTKVYPTEFVVRTFLADYPNKNMARPKPGEKILDVGFGDGRNTAFLCEQQLSVSGVEITKSIVNQTQERLIKLGHTADLRVGRNSSLPFDNEEFDYILACHSCYYCDEGQTLFDNLNEYYRVLKKQGFIIASVANKNSYIFENSIPQNDGSLLIMNDPYNDRVGYRLHAFATEKEVEQYFSVLFTNFSFGSADNNYYGLSEKVFWVICQKD